MSQIKVTKVDEFTNTWTFVDDDGNDKYSFKVSNIFSPVRYKNLFTYIKEVTESRCKVTEKMVLTFLATHGVFGTTVSPYGSSAIARDLGLSYKTVRTVLNGLEKQGMVSSAAVMTPSGNLGRQYRVNEEFNFREDSEMEVYYWDSGDDGEPVQEFEV